MLLSYLCAHGAKLCDMDKAQKQQGRIVLFKEEKDGVAYVRIDYSDHPSIVLLLSQDGQVKGVRAASQTHKRIHATGRLSFVG